MQKYSTPNKNTPHKRPDYQNAICSEPKKAKYLNETTDTQPHPGILNLFDHWWYTVYSDEIHDTLRERELLRKHFKDQSPQAEHRDVFIGSIRKIGVMERLSRTTIHLAIYVLDVFMDNHHIALDRLGMASICSLLLAAKIEERDTNIPKLANLSRVVEGPCRLSDYNLLEGMILKFFEFQLMIPTAATFLEYFIEGIVDDSDFEVSNENHTRFHSIMAMKRELTDLALEFLDLTLLNVYMVQELPSKMAAACLAAARCTLAVVVVWPYHLLIMTKYSLNEIRSQMQQLQHFRLNVMSELATAELQSPTSTTPDSGYMSYGDLCMEETDISSEE